MDINFRYQSNSFLLVRYIVSTWKPTFRDFHLNPKRPFFLVKHLMSKSDTNSQGRIEELTDAMSSSSTIRSVVLVHLVKEKERYLNMYITIYLERERDIKTIFIVHFNLLLNLKNFFFLHCILSTTLLLFCLDLSCKYRNLRNFLRLDGLVIRFEG